MENTAREKNAASDAKNAKMKHANVDASAVMIHQITGSTIKIRKVSTANAAHRAARCIKQGEGRVASVIFITPKHSACVFDGAAVVFAAADDGGFAPFFAATLHVGVCSGCGNRAIRRVVARVSRVVGGSYSSCLCFASGFLPTPHYCDAVAFGYLIPPCQRLIGDFHPSYVSCLTY